MRYSIKRRLRHAQAMALLVSVAICSPAAYAADASTIASAQQAFAQQVKAVLSPAEQTWLAKEAQVTLAGKTISSAAVRQQVSTHFAARKFDEATIEALVLALLVEVESQGAADQRSIKSAMSKVKEAQEAIAAMDRLKAALDSLSDTSQQLTFDLQQGMQRLSEAATVKSNISAKDASTKDAIIGNIRG